MVGIPRSRGCHACRKRKKACSLETPECQNCVKAGKRCPGYARERKFVHPSSNNVPWKAAHREQTSQEVPAAVESEQSKAAAKGVLLSGERVDDAVRSLDGSSSDAAVAVCPASTKSLLAQMDQMQLLSAFRSRYQAETIQAPRDYWFVEAGRHAQMSNALHISMLAFGAAKIGRIYKDMSLVRSGHRMYAQGLNELQKALWDPRLMYSDDTLGACVLLALFETSECPAQSRTGFQNHYDGCAALIKARGPEAHVAGLGQAIFSSFRTIGAFEGIINRGTFLSESVWKDVPFRQVPKTRLDLLVDLILELIPLLSYSNEIEAMTDQHQQTLCCYELLHSVIELEDRFAQFYSDLEGSKGSICWPARRSRDGFESDDLLFPVYFAFQDMHTASLSVLCWAMQATLLAIITLLQNELQMRPDLQTVSQLTPVNSQSILFYSSAALNMARQVCQSVEFCLYTSPYTVGPPAVMAPLRCILDTLAPWPIFSNEREWILRTLKRLQQHGMGIVPYLHQVPNGYAE